ncbi:hypothetical protein K438DRAFT_1637245, partial [Mycena galopus ATCC 62051]
GTHLIPVPGSAHIPVNFQYYHWLDAFKTFHVNKYIDHHANEIAYRIQIRTRCEFKFWEHIKFCEAKDSGLGWDAGVNMRQPSQVCQLAPAEIDFPDGPATKKARNSCNNVARGHRSLLTCS